MSREWEIWDEERAEYYEKTYGLSGQAKAAHASRMKLAQTLIEGKTVLDVGCGVGHFYPYASSYGYTGIDSSPDMIKKAKNNFPDGVFKIGDIYDLSEHEVCDSTLSQSLFIHLPDFEKPIKQLWSRTRKVMVFSIPVGRIKTINHREMKDKYLISHREPKDYVIGFCKSLPGVDEVTLHVEPNTVISNTYFRVSKKWSILKN